MGKLLQKLAGFYGADCGTRFAYSPLANILVRLGQALAAFGWVRVRPSYNKKNEAPMRSRFSWCGRQDSNLHAFAEEPKGDVTLVKAFLQAFAIMNMF